MLVLTRKKNEKVVLSVPGLESLIEITCVSLNDDRVRLGFEAPREVTIHRLEVQEAIDASPQSRNEGNSTDTLPARLGMEDAQNGGPAPEVEPVQEDRT